MYKKKINEQGKLNVLSFKREFKSCYLVIIRSKCEQLTQEVYTNLSP